jgi:hypothetical protein
MDVEGREKRNLARLSAARAYSEQRAIHVSEGARFLRDPAAEQVILGDWRYAWLYSRDVLRHRWPEFEVAMATMPPTSDPSEIRSVYNYARYVVCGRLEAAECHLAKDATAAVDYARDVLRHVWRDGMAHAEQANALIDRHPTARSAYRTPMGMR